MNLSLEMELALVTFAAVVAAQLGKADLRMLQSFVKGTKTNLDDKILTAVMKALKDVHTVRIVDSPKFRGSRDTVIPAPLYPLD